MTDRELLRRRVASVAPVGGGTVLLGLSAYVVLAVAAHSLTPRDYAAVASLYLLVAITGPGIFIAVEQEANREVSNRLAASVGTHAIRRGGAAVAAALAAVVVVALLALSPLLVPAVLGGSWVLMGAAVVAVAGAAAVYLLRGIFAGERRYSWYATSLAAEGAARILPCLVLGFVGVSSAGAYGFAFALGTGIAALLCLPGLRAGESGPPIDVSRMSRGALMLAFASGLTFLVANAAPLVLTSRLPDQPAVAASFVSLFVLARIPVFLFTPLQAFLLPGLTAAVEARDAARVRSRMVAAMLAVAAVGVPLAVLTAVLGPWAARMFLNAPLDQSWTTAGLLGLSTVAMMAAQAMQPALVALGVQRMASIAWITGTAAFAVLLFLPVDPVAAAVAAQLSAPVLVTVMMAVTLLHALKQVRIPIDGRPGPAMETRT